MTLTETYAFDSGRARWRVRLGKLVENQAVLTATVCTLFFVQLVATFLVLSSCDATTAPVLDSLSFAASCVCVGALCLMALQLSLLVVAFDLRFFFHLGYLLDVIIVALASAYAINDYSFVGCLFLVAGAWRILPLACAIVDKRRSNVLPSSALGAVSTGSLISDDDLSFQIQRACWHTLFIYLLKYIAYFSYWPMSRTSSQSPRTRSRRPRKPPCASTTSSCTAPSRPSRLPSDVTSTRSPTCLSWMSSTVSNASSSVAVIKIFKNLL